MPPLWRLTGHLTGNGTSWDRYLDHHLTLYNVSRHALITEVGASAKSVGGTLHRGTGCSSVTYQVLHGWCVPHFIRNVGSELTPELGTLTFLSEIISSHLAGVQFKTSPSKATALTPLLDGLKIEAWTVKAGLYDFAVSAPLGYFLNMWVQKLFAGKTSRGARLAWLIVQNFLVAPFQTFGER